MSSVDTLKPVRVYKIGGFVAAQSSTTSNYYNYLNNRELSNNSFNQNESKVALKNSSTQYQNQPNYKHHDYNEYARDETKRSKNNTNVSEISDDDEMLENQSEKIVNMKKKKKIPKSKPYDDAEHDREKEKNYQDHKLALKNDSFETEDLSDFESGPKSIERKYATQESILRRHENTERYEAGSSKRHSQFIIKTPRSSDGRLFAIRGTTKKVIEVKTTEIEEENHFDVLNSSIHLNKVINEKEARETIDDSDRPKTKNKSLNTVEKTGTETDEKVFEPRTEDKTEQTVSKMEKKKKPKKLTDSVDKVDAVTETDNNMINSVIDMDNKDNLQNIKKKKKKKSVKKIDAETETDDNKILPDEHNQGTNEAHNEVDKAPPIKKKKKLKNTEDQNAGKEKKFNDQGNETKSENVLKEDNSPYTAIPEKTKNKKVKKPTDDEITQNQENYDDGENNLKKENSENRNNILGPKKTKPESNVKPLLTDVTDLNQKPLESNKVGKKDAKVSQSQNDISNITNDIKPFSNKNKLEPIDDLLKNEKHKTLTDQKSNKNVTNNRKTDQKPTNADDELKRQTFSLLRPNKTDKKNSDIKIDKSPKRLDHYDSNEQSDKQKRARQTNKITHNLDEPKIRRHRHENCFKDDWGYILMHGLNKQKAFHSSRELSKVKKKFF